MSREEVYTFIETVNKIKADVGKGVPLSEYFPADIAHALESLIASAVTQERNACAAIAEDAAGGSGTFTRGGPMGADTAQRDLALRIAESIRSRKG